jgi:DNA-binding transcriptional ArsR family regulator
MVLAHSGGLLFSADADELLSRLDELCRHAPTELLLASEAEADRLAVRGRLEVLRTSPTRRRRYVEVVTEVWTAVRPIWESKGRAAVDRAVAVRRDLIASGAPWAEVARGDCDYGDELRDLVRGLGPTGELAVVPAYFTHLGLLIDFPGVVVVGVRVESSAADRERIELLARRLKAVSDGTRLAILESLSAAPRTITDLARSFSLAQPTVSNHVKVLRDAGLVSSSARGGRRELTIEHDGVQELLERLAGVLRRDPRPRAEVE